jgi:hypothetical protein
MKTFLNVSVIAVFLLFCTGRVQAQTTQPKLDQMELMKNFIGAWQANAGKDTVEVWDCQQYGKAFIINVYHLVKNQKSPVYVNNVGYDSRDDKVKGYVLWVNGAYTTWIAVFTTEKKFAVDIVDNFDPEKVWLKYEMLYISPTERIWTEYNTSGVKVSEMKFTKTN